MCTLTRNGYIFKQVFSSWITFGKFVFTFMCTEVFKICSVLNLMNCFFVLILLSHDKKHKVYYKFRCLITTYYAYKFVFSFCFLYQNLKGFWRFCCGTMAFVQRDPDVIGRLVLSSLRINIHCCFVN